MARDRQVLAGQIDGPVQLNDSRQDWKPVEMPVKDGKAGLQQQVQFYASLGRPYGLFDPGVVCLAQHLTSSPTIRRRRTSRRRR